MTNLSDRLDSFAEGWRPKPGDKLIGTVTDRDLRESDYEEQEPYVILTVEVEEGSTQAGEMIAPGTEIAWHAFHTIARNEIVKRAPAVGDHVGIAYHGPAEKAAPGQKPAERFRLIVDRRSAPPPATEPAPADAEAADAGPTPEEEEDSSRQEWRPAFDDDIAF